MVGQLCIFMCHDNDIEETKISVSVNTVISNFKRTTKLLNISMYIHSYLAIAALSA